MLNLNLPSYNGNKLSQDEKESISKELTLDELTVAMTKLKLGRTSGCDGLSPEIYCFLWDLFGQIVFNAIQYAISTVELHLSAKEA